MDAFTRITHFAPTSDVPDWIEDDFAEAAVAAMGRWRSAVEQFDVRFSLFSDGVSLIDPDFQIPEEMVATISRTPVPTGRNVTWRMALAFVKWAECPVTRDCPNPYEPLVAIWEHGGSFSMEHSIFVDIYDATGATVCGLVLSLPGPDPDSIGHPGRQKRSERKANRRRRRRGEGES